MSYGVRKNRKGFYTVYNLRTGTVMGTRATREQALRYKRDLILRRTRQGG